MDEQARCWVEISLKAITENFARLQRAVGPEVEVLAVVKADAYNHGAGKTAVALENAGARSFAVASVEEGVALRQAGIRGSVLVLSGVFPWERDAVLRQDLTPVLHSPSDLVSWNELAARQDRRLSYHFKIDTGLGRMGSRAGCDEIAAAIRQASHCDLKGLMSHLAASEDFLGGSAGRQLTAFDEACRGLRPLLDQTSHLHVANSAAVVYGRQGAWYSMVRAGLSLYGYVSPAAGEPPVRLTGLEPALTWKARVLAVKEVEAGTPIGYGGTYRAKAPLRVAVLAAGYADGYPHRLGNRGSVIVSGCLAPVIGVVSMDLLTVDVTNCPATAPGDAVTLLGSEGQSTMDALEMARLAETIPYVILCGIGKRVARFYR